MDLRLTVASFDALSFATVKLKKHFYNGIKNSLY